MLQANSKCDSAINMSTPPSFNSVMRIPHRQLTRMPDFFAASFAFAITFALISLDHTPLAGIQTQWAPGGRPGSDS